MSAGAAQHFSRPSQNPGLDLLRFVAAAAVALGHIRAATFGAYGALSVDDKSPAAAAFYALTRLGGEAVIVFFVLLQRRFIEGLTQGGLRG